MRETKSKSGLASLVRRPLLAGAIAAAAAAPSSALADVFLRLDGIQGESTDDKHKGEIDILSYTQTFKNTSDPTGGGGGGGGAPQVTCGDVTVLKNIDKSSPLLIKAVTTGQQFKTAVLTFRRVGKTQAEYYVVTLDDVLIRSIDQTDENNAARIFERVTIQSSKFKFAYRQQNPDGTLGAPVEFAFDCVAGKTS